MPQLAATFALSPELLCRLLQLPEGAYIDRIVDDPTRPGVLVARIVGAGWPVVPGKLLEQVHPIWRTEHSEDGKWVRETIDWGLPA